MGEMDVNQTKNVSKVRQFLKWSCGCGKTFYQQSDAVKHVARTSHTMDVKGELTPTQRLTRKVKAKVHQRRHIDG